MPNRERRPVKLFIMGAARRRESLNARLASLAAECAASNGGTVDYAHISDFDCPFYDGDVEKEQGVPDGAVRFCHRIKDADAFIWSSPEYNASMPGEIKNLIDWTSRLRPQPFNGKQALLMSASPSMVGGNRGLWSLRIPLEHLGTRVYPDMFSLAQSHEAFDEKGSLTNDLLRKRLDETIKCFMDLVEAAKHYPAVQKQWVEFLGEHPNKATDRVETQDVEAA
jgi:NAD(P)H-dependent FMN reductase